MEKNKEFLIEHRLTRKCNYACSYCYEKFDDSFDNVPVDFDGLKHFLDCYKDYDILYNIIGGEPTRHPDLKLLTEFLSNYDNIQIKISTNASKPLVFNNKKILGKYSFHPEFTTLEQFNKNVEKSNIELHEIMIVYSEHIKNNDEYFYKLKEKYGDKLKVAPHLSNLFTKPEVITKIENPDVYLNVKNNINHTNNLYYDWFNYKYDIIGKRCYLNKDELLIQDNYVYHCINFASKEMDGIKLSEYNQYDYKICKFKYCIWSSHYTGIES